MMAATLTGVGRMAFSALCRGSVRIPRTTSRCLSFTQGFWKDTDKDVDKGKVNNIDDEQKSSWMKRLLRVRTVDPGTKSHSQALSDKDTVYELQIHCVKPEFMETYLQQFQRYVERTNEKQTGAELAGSWTVDIGDQDEAIHLWKYAGGYAALNKARSVYRSDKELLEYRISRNKMLRSRKNQILLSFSFWPDIKPREPDNIYELRSYVLKPGTMIEWGNNWARGLQLRTGYNEAVAGYFSHIGDLYNIHHFWAYKDLQTRKDVRENAWNRPGWDECVSYTVPLIRHMTTRILIPTPFSPLQ